MNFLMLNNKKVDEQKDKVKPYLIIVSVLKPTFLYNLALAYF